MLLFPVPLINAGAAAYVGPGSIVAGASAWWGLRAYTNASIGSNAVRLREDGGNTEQDFATVSGGGLNLAAISSFKGANNVFITALYDQTGNGNHLIQGIAVSQPALILSGIGALPVIRFDGTDDILQLASFTLSAPYSFSLVYNASSGNFDVIFGSLSAFGSLGVNNSGANTIYGSFATTVNVTAANSAFHAIQMVVNGASGDICVDGSSNISNLGSAGLSGAVQIGSFSGGNLYSGDLTEIGVWPTSFSAGNESGLNSNQHGYWGF